MPSPQPLPTPAPWQAIISEHCQALTVAGRRPESIRLRRDWIRRLARAFPSGYGLTEHDLIAWSAAHDWKQETRRSAHSQVNEFYKWAALGGYVPKRIGLPPIPKAPAVARPAGDDALVYAMEHADTDVRLMIRLAYEMGLRRGEVARSHSRDVIQDLLGYTLIVHGKGGKQRLVPIPDSLAYTLRQRGTGFFFPGQDGGHLSPAWIGKLVARALPDGVTMHMLRHRFATRAYAATGDILSVQVLLGHSSPDTTIRYIQLGQDRLRATVIAAA